MFRLEDIHISWRSVDESIKHAVKLIADHELYLIQVKRTSSEGLQGVRDEYKSLENFKRTLDDDDKNIQQITKNYSDVLHIYPTADPSSEMRIRIKELNNRWEALNGLVHETMKNV